MASGPTPCQPAMTMRFVDAETVHAALDWGGLVEALRRGHRRPKAETGRLFQTSDDDGLLILPAWEAGAAIGVKLVTIFPGNLGGPHPSVQAIYVVFDGTSGAARAVIDGTALTYRKTAADSALAADLLARPDVTTLLVVGAGGLAPYLLAAHRAVRPSLQRVLVWNRTADRALRLAETAGGEMVTDLESAVAQADVITCATMSTEPLVEGVRLRPGTHVDLVGAYRPDLRESDDEVMRRGRVFVDNPETTIEEAGDLVQPIASGAIDRNDVLGDLFVLCAEPSLGRISADDITVFKNGGGGHLDLMVAEHLLAQL